MSEKKKRANRGFEFVPAVIDNCVKGLSMGVRYEKNKRYELRRVKNGFEIALADRTLHLYRSFDFSKNRLFGADLDESVDLDILLNQDVLGEMGFNFSMVNAEAYPRKYDHDDYDAAATPMKTSIIADSGGFQLNQGVRDFIDPETIIKKQNRICDIGIVLDVPLSDQYQEQLLGRAARVQKGNTEILLKHKRKSLELMNVIHGSTFYLRRKYRDAVHDDRIDRAALGGVKHLDLVSMAMLIMQCALDKHSYKHFHILGVSGLEKWLVLCYMARKKVIDLITSDSSTYMQHAVNLQYFNPIRLAGVYDFRNAFKSNAPRWPALIYTSHQFVRKHLPMPCSCEYCSIMGSSLVISDTKNTLGGRLLVGHNLIVSHQWISQIWELAAQPKPEILKFLKTSHSNKVNSVNKALSAIDAAVDSGPDKAAAKYAPHLLEKFLKGERRGLFAASKSVPDTKEYKRFDTVLTRYEKFLGINK